MKNWASMLAPLALLGCENADERSAQEPPKHWPEAFTLSCRTPFGRGWPPGFQASIDLKQGRYWADYPTIGDGNIVRVDGPIIVLAEWTIPKGMDNNPEHFTVSFDRRTGILTRIHEYSAFMPGRDVQTSQCEVRTLRLSGPSVDREADVPGQQPVPTSDADMGTKNGNQSVLSVRESRKGLQAFTSA